MELVDLEKEEYIEFTKNNNAHFLESYEWGIISEYRGYEIYRLGLKDGKKIKASALLIKKHLPFGYCYYYIPRGYTINYSDKEILKIFTEKLKEFAKKTKAIFFKIDPDIKLHTIDENANKIDGEDNYELVNYLKELGYKHQKLTRYFETMQPRFTFRISLDNSLEEVESRYTSTTKSRIKKANNSMVSVVEGKSEDVDEFVRLMKMTEKRQNFYSHDLDYYKFFFDTFSKSDMVKLYLGKIDIKGLKEKLNNEKKALIDEFESLKDITNKKANGRKKELEKNINSINDQIEFLKDKKDENVVVSSYLTVFYNDKAWALYAANDMEYRTFYANYAIYQKQIEDSFNSGKKVFDVFGTIGDPTGDSHLLGLHDFKKKWGGEYTEFVGEFDYILNPVYYFLFKKIIPIRHKIINKYLRKKGK